MLMKEHPVYVRWKGMIQRCCNPNHPAFIDYGGRGITICEEWRNDFWTYARDIGLPPTPEHQLDRIDNDGNYEPSNCRWATTVQQRRNRRDYDEDRPDPRVVNRKGARWFSILPRV